MQFENLLPRVGIKVFIWLDDFKSALIYSSTLYNSYVFFTFIKKKETFFPFLECKGNVIYMVCYNFIYNNLTLTSVVIVCYENGPWTVVGCSYL